MLHKSFKPAKCKTALKLVASRAKLLKNKKEVVVKQLRRDLAQLLEQGQVQTARIRVEHVVREEKMMAAYELIEIFSELIAIRLPIIESQKECPIDLKEAVSSIIFATPRCSDILELKDVRKHFTAKYGKEFVSAAIELRPNCGVNRTLVEKLSAKSPDGPTKLKILTAIAEEHNIKWDLKSFGEDNSNPQEVLLNGPKTFEYVEPSNLQAPYSDRVSPNVHISPEHEVKQEDPINYHANNVRSSFGSQNISPTRVNASAAPSPILKPSGNGIDRVESSNLYSDAQNSNFVNQQNWSMEFKDATSAAQAAAESAERASMAARAAAELSSRGKIMPQYSTGSHSSNAYASRDEVPTRHSWASVHTEAFTTGQRSDDLGDGSSRSQNEEIAAKEQHNFLEHAETHYGDGNKRHDRPSELSGAAYTLDSSKGNNPLSRPPEHRMSGESSQGYAGWNYKNQSSVNEDEEEDVDLATLTERLSGNSHRSETGSRLSSSKETIGDSFNNKAPSDTPRNSQNLPHPENVITIDEFYMRRQSEKFEVEHPDEAQDVLRTEKASNLEERFTRHSSSASSYSHSSFSSSVSDHQNYVEPNNQNLEDVIGNPFANFNEEKYHEDTKTTDTTSVVFDDYGSDGENPGFDLDKGPPASSHTFSPDIKLTSYQSENINAPSLRRNRIDLFGKSISESHSSREQSSTAVFSEFLDDSDVGMHEDELPPVIYDDARNPHSESKEELENSESDREENVISRPKKSELTLIGKCSHKFDDPVDEKNRDHPLHSRESLTHEVDDDTWVQQRSAIVDDLETPGKSSSVGATELSFGKLTGGLRNKGYRHPPYVRGMLGEVSSTKQATASETKKSSVSSAPKTWSTSENDDDAYNKEGSTEIQKTLSNVGMYGRSSLGQVSGARTSLENTAKKSSFSLSVNKESIDSEVDPSTQDKDVEYNRPSGRLEEKSMGSLSGEVPLSKQEVADSLINHGFSRPPGQISGSHLEWNNHGVDSVAGRRSDTHDSISSYDSEQSKDPKEEVLSQVLSSRARYGAGLSRRTKGSLSKADSSSPLNSSPAHREETGRPLRYSSTSSHSDRMSKVKPTHPSKKGDIQEDRVDMKSSMRQERRADTRSSSTQESRADERSSAQDRMVDLRSSAGERRPDVRSSSTQDGMVELLSSSTGERKADIKSSSRSSYPTEAYSSTRSDSAASDNKGSSSWLQPSKNTVVKPKSEPLKLSEQPSDSLQMSGSSGPSQSSKAAKPSLGDTSRENSFNRASHVHPKLPDYDSIAAQLELLRMNRK